MPGKRITEKDWDIVGILFGREMSLPQIQVDLGSYPQSQKELVRRLDKLIRKEYVVSGKTPHTFTASVAGQKAFDQWYKAQS